MTGAIGIFLAPFVALLLIAFVARPLSRMLWRALPEGRVRRFLFRRI